MLQWQSTEVILFYPDSQVCHKKTKGTLEVKPVIAVTGSGQKIRPPLATPALNTLMAQTELGSEISLLQQGLSSGPRLLFFLPSHPQSSSLLREPFHPDKLEACVDFVAIAERSWQRCSKEMKQEFISQLPLLFLRLQGKIIGALI